MMADPADSGPAASIVEARFRVHGLSIGVRSDEPSVIDTLGRSYAA